MIQPGQSMLMIKSDATFRSNAAPVSERWGGPGQRDWRRRPLIRHRAADELSNEPGRLRDVPAASRSGIAIQWADLWKPHSCREMAVPSQQLVVAGTRGQRNGCHEHYCIWYACRTAGELT